MFIPEVELELCGASASSNSSSALPTSILEGEGAIRMYVQALDLCVCARQCLHDWRSLIWFNTKAQRTEVLISIHKA